MNIKTYMNIKYKRKTTLCSKKTQNRLINKTNKKKNYKRYLYLVRSNTSVTNFIPKTFTTLMKNICILHHEQKDIFSEVIWKTCFKFIICLVYMTTGLLPLKSCAILDEVVEWPIWNIIATEVKNYGSRRGLKATVPGKYENSSSERLSITPFLYFCKHEVAP